MLFMCSVITWYNLYLLFILLCNEFTFQIFSFLPLFTRQIYIYHIFVLYHHHHRFCWSGPVAPVPSVPIVPDSPFLRSRRRWLGLARRPSGGGWGPGVPDTKATPDVGGQHVCCRQGNWDRDPPGENNREFHGRNWKYPTFINNNSIIMKCWDHGLKNNTRFTRICDPTKKKSLWWRHYQSDIGGPSVLCLTISRNAFVLRCIWLK